VEVNVVPEGISFVSNRPASSNLPEGALERSRKGPVCNPKISHAATELMRLAHSQLPPPEPPVRAPPNVQAHPAKLASSTPEEKVVSC